MQTGRRSFLGAVAALFTGLLGSRASAATTHMLCNDWECPCGQNYLYDDFADVDFALVEEGKCEECHWDGYVTEQDIWLGADVNAGDYLMSDGLGLAVPWQPGLGSPIFGIAKTSGRKGGRH